MADWHDINEPGFFFKPQPEPDDNTGFDLTPDDDGRVEPKEPELRFLSAEFLPHPVHGYRINKPALVRGTAEFLKKTKRVRIAAETDAATSGASFEKLNNFSESTVSRVDGTFECEVPLYLPQGYPHNGSATHTTPIRYRCTLTHSLHEKPLEVFLDLPAGSTAPVLKQGMFDDKGIACYPDRLHNQKQGYVENDPIYRVQDMLIRMGFLSQQKPDGDFGPKTDQAVRDFQQTALAERQAVRLN